jgi:hypothetical protein
MGMELKAHLIIRKMLDKFSDNDYDSLLKKISRHKEVFLKHNRDSGLRLALGMLLREPGLIRYGTRLL